MQETGLAEGRTAVQLAAEIREIKSRTSGILQAALGVARQSCFEIGRRLEAAKALVPHGEWGTWLEQNVEYSETTANNLMRIYREYGSGQVDLFSGKCDAEVFGGLNQSQLVELFALPRGERAAFVEAHGGAADLSVRQMREEIEQWKSKADRLRCELDTAESKRADLERGYTAELRDSVRRVQELEKQLEDAQAVREVVVQTDQPDAATLEAICSRAREEAEEEAAGQWADRLAEARKNYERQLEEAERRRQESLEQLSVDRNAQVARAEADAAAAREKAAAEMEKMQEQLQRAQAGAKRNGDAHTVRISVFLATLRKALDDISAELDDMNREESGTGDAMQRRVEVTLGKLLDAKGWQI